MELRIGLLVWGEWRVGSKLTHPIEGLTHQFLSKHKFSKVRSHSSETRFTDKVLDKMVTQ